MESWFHDPVGNCVEKSGGDNGGARMVLHSDDRSFSIERAIGVAQTQNVGELQRRGAGKQHFSRGTEFDDGVFLHARATGWLYSRCLLRVN